MANERAVTMSQDKADKAELEDEIRQKDERIAELSDSLRDVGAELAEIKMDGIVRDLATKAGAPPAATTDIIHRARPVWRLIDGAPTAFEPGTEDRRLLGRTGKPLTVSEWLQDLAASADFLFAKNNDGERSSDTKGSSSSEDNVIGRNLEDFAAGKMALMS